MKTASTWNSRASWSNSEACWNMLLGYEAPVSYFCRLGFDLCLKRLSWRFSTSSLSPPQKWWNSCMNEVLSSCYDIFMRFVSLLQYYSSFDLPDVIFLLSLNEDYVTGNAWKFTWTALANGMYRPVMHRYVSLFRSSEWQRRLIVTAKVEMHHSCVTSLLANVSRNLFLIFFISSAYL